MMQTKKCGRAGRFLPHSAPFRLQASKSKSYCRIPSPWLTSKFTCPARLSEHPACLPPSPMLEAWTGSRWLLTRHFQQFPLSPGPGRAFTLPTLFFRFREPICMLQLHTTLELFFLWQILFPYLWVNPKNIVPRALLAHMVSLCSKRFPLWSYEASQMFQLGLQKVTLSNSKIYIFFTCGWTQLDFQSPWCAHCLVHVTTFKTIAGTPEDTSSSFHLLDAFPPFLGHLYETKLTDYSGRLWYACVKAVKACKVTNYFISHTHPAKISGALGKPSIKEGPHRAGVNSDFLWAMVIVSRGPAKVKWMKSLRQSPEGPKSCHQEKLHFNVTF